MTMFSYNIRQISQIMVYHMIHRNPIINLYVVAVVVVLVLRGTAARFL
jgi:hypothetical protein